MFFHHICETMTTEVYELIFQYDTNEFCRLILRNEYFMFENNIGIEDKIELIESSSTKTYFKEVYSSYLNGNYRAAVVSLWSVLVCDAVYKTRRLVDLTNDHWAKQQINSIEASQRQNSTKSDWELKLFEGFYDQKKFIGIGEITNIRDIQQKRHLCAHPILSEDDVLYTPNKDLVKA